MNEEEKILYLKDFTEFCKELVFDRDKAAKFLQDAGIHNKNGRLTKRYKG